MPEWDCPRESSAWQQQGRNAVWGHCPAPGGCPVPSQIAALLPGLVLDIQLFPSELGAAKPNTGSGNCCSGSSLLSRSCKSPAGLPAGRAPWGPRHATGPSAGESRAPVAPRRLKPAPAPELLRAVQKGLLGSHGQGAAGKCSGHSCGTGPAGSSGFSLRAAIPAARSLFPGAEDSAARLPPRERPQCVGVLVRFPWSPDPGMLQGQGCGVNQSGVARSSSPDLQLDPRSQNLPTLPRTAAAVLSCGVPIAPPGPSRAASNALGTNPSPLPTLISHH